MPKKIIIQGDDWGYNPATIAGINYAYEHGILTETDVMANLLEPDKKAEYRSLVRGLKNKSGLPKPPLGIGVHLNLTYGSPITSTWPHPTMARPFKGTNQPEEWQGAAWTTAFAEFDPELIKREFVAQIERVLDIFGAIDHLDSHHFVHSYPPITQVVLNLAQQYQVKAVRNTAPLSQTPVYGGDFVVDESFPAMVKTQGLVTPEKTILKLYWNNEHPVESFLADVANLPEDVTAEFMVHPAQGEQAEAWRVKDLELTTHPQVIDYFQTNQIQLITYQQL